LQALAWGLVIATLAWAWRGAEMRPLALLKDWRNMVKFGIDFFPPDFREWKSYLEEMAITIQVAIWGTLLAMIFAVPFGLLASKNIAPWWIYQPVRRLLDSARAINEMMFAMLFVVVVGMGPFAGVLALFVHTTGILAKLFSEAVEAIDPRPVEGIRVTGATSIEVITFGIIPQVMPLWVSYSLYRFESNVRSASVVGMVGAGGIGMVLWEIIQGFQFRQTCAVILIIIAACSAIDMVSSQVRRIMI
jgi:phosphonate transport system permease protein